MFTVMLVDDEEISLLELKRLIGWEKMGFEVVVEAQNGKSALEEIEKQKIDLVITDIKMPIVNGIELLKELKEKQLCDCVILLSGYMDFNYAQQGLTLGAFNYILKPIDTEKLEKVLETAHQYLTEKKDKDDSNKLFIKMSEMNFKISRDKILADIIRGRILPHRSLQEVVQEYNIHINEQIIRIAVLEIDDIDSNADEWIKNGKDSIIIDLIRGKAREILTQFERINLLIDDGEFGSLNLLLQARDNALNEEEFKTETKKLLKLLLQEINTVIGTEVTIGVGKVYDDIKNINMSYLDAKDALKHKFVFGRNRIIEREKLEINYSSDFLYPVDNEKLLISYLMLGDNRAIEIAEDTYQEIYKGNRNNVLMASRILNQIVINIEKNISGKYNSLNKIYSMDKLTDNSLLTIKSSESLHINFTNIVNEVLTIIREFKLNQKDRIINKACEYVIEHMDEEISLKSISEHFFISKNYFCYLFKQETGENFLEYLTKIKIERAKILLKESDYKAYEISGILGFQESAYFGKLFRKYTGYSPTEYRKYLQSETKVQGNHTIKE